MIRIQFSPKHINQFRKLGIETIYLFGSQAQGRTGPLSDFDIGVVFEKPEKYRDKAMKPYLELYKIFTEVLPKEYLRRRFKMRKHEFDIVFLQFAPMRLQLEAAQNGKILYEKNLEKRLSYEEYVLKRNCDLKYFYDLRYQAILERI